MNLSEVANNMFKERLQTVTGVSEIRIYGEKKYAIKILLDPAKLAAYKLAPSDIRNAVTRENVELPPVALKDTIRN
jgi:multidrug efflux pump